MSGLPQKKKPLLAVIYGGRSGEHEVSITSAAAIVANLDKKKYRLLPVYIDRRGPWLAGVGPKQAAAALEHRRPIKAADGWTAVRRADIVLPIVHGTGGEDGALQGWLELCGIPYVGSGVLGSAVGMDKDVQKRLLKLAGLPILPYLAFTAAEWRERRSQIIKQCHTSLRWPLFIKPANLGSSVGITKTRTTKELIRGIALALRYDTKVVVEQGLERPREVECGVIGLDRPQVSKFGEIEPANDFYDYEAKYASSGTKLAIPADLPAQTEALLAAYAERTYRVLEAGGFSRIDFFLTRGPRPKIYVNEINTLPGFTAGSMFPKLWAASGLPFGKLLDRLISCALERSRWRSRLTTDARKK